MELFKNHLPLAFPKQLIFDSCKGDKDKNEVFAADSLDQTRKFKDTFPMVLYSIFSSDYEKEVVIRRQ